MDQPSVGDDGAFRATDTGVTWRCLHAMQSANRDCNHATMMSIMQQRHVRQSRSTSTNVIHVIIYLSIYELGARHRQRASEHTNTLHRWPDTNRWIRGACGERSLFKESAPLSFGLGCDTVSDARVKVCSVTGRCSDKPGFLSCAGSLAACGPHSEVGDAPEGAPRLVGDGLLREEARGGDHAEAAVLQLLGLHLAELGRVLGLEAERVEAQVARDVADIELLEDVVGLVRVRPADLKAVRLGHADAKRHGEPHEDGQLRDLVDCRAAVPGEERVELLLHEEARRRQHAHAAVRKLCLAPRQHLVLGLAVQHVEGVKVTNGRQRSRQAVAELGRRRRLEGLRVDVAHAIDGLHLGGRGDGAPRHLQALDGWHRGEGERGGVDRQHGRA
mmetsp:Transcript_43700/g.128671  ORF Transcript_43700/g.128671 Transcript_43700/m.128671 type:complete len:388 (+) Transcript_43700:96-1259(+)